MELLHWFVFLQPLTLALVVGTKREIIIVIGKGSNAIYSYFTIRRIYFFDILFVVIYNACIYHQVICGVLAKMEPKRMDVEDQRRLEIAPTWASLPVQLGYHPSSYNKTIPFCSITKIIVLPIIYFHSSSGKHLLYQFIVLDDQLRYNWEKRKKKGRINT